MHVITFSHRESMKADYGLSHSSSSPFSFHASSLLSYKIVGYQVLSENQPEFIQSFTDYGSSCLTVLCGGGAYIYTDHMTVLHTQPLK